MIIRCAPWSARAERVSGKRFPQERGGLGGSSPRVSTGIGEFTDSLPRRCAGRPPGTWSATARWQRATTSGWSCRASPRWPTSAWCRPCCGEVFDAGLALMASALRDLLHDAPVGSDTQLAYVRAFAGVAISADDLALLAGLLDGSVVLDGLTVDTDLRWSLLWRLVSRGVCGKDEIDAELARDATDAGERHAAACRAAIPTAEAKQEAWETLIRGELTIAMFRAVLAGFADPDQPELAGALPGEVLRGGWGRVAELVVGDGAGLRQRCLRGVPGYGCRDGRRDGRLCQRPRIARPRCAACSPRAAYVLRALRCQARDRQEG